MLDMNRLFERFVTRLVRDSLPVSGLTVAEQRRVRAVIRDDRTGCTYSTIRPDLLIEDSRAEQGVPVDIKYQLHADTKIAAGDVYQLFLYGYVHGTDAASRRAGLIYPATCPAAGPALSIHTVVGPTAARITGVGVDVPAVLELISAGDTKTLRATVRAVVGAVTGLGDVSTRTTHTLLECLINGSPDNDLRRSHR
jgi:5-methylcytosine-specific restriction enzyme subunit McrC